MQFAPFPLSLLGRLAEPPRTGSGDGLELLPFLRWVAGHSTWREVATVADSRGFLPPVLPHALPDGTATRCHLLDGDTLAGLPVAALDFLHVTAEFAPGELLGLLRAAHPRLAPGALVLAPPLEGDASGFVMLALPIGDGGGVLLQPRGTTEHPLLAWLQAQDPAAVADLGRFFDRLAAHLAQAARIAALQARVAVEVSEAQKQARLGTALRHRLEDASAQEQQHLAAMDVLRQQLGALHSSTSWRLTAPLRRAVLALGRGRPALPDARQPAVVPSPVAEGDTALARFLASSEVLSFRAADASSLSVVLVLDGEAGHALACLRSVAAAGCGALELVIVENGPTDGTSRLLERVVGARVVRNAVRLSPAQALAEAMAVAASPDLLLLDPRTRLWPAALRAALGTLEEHPQAGAVTGKVVATDGSLVEAGALFGTDGQVLAFPRGYSAGMPDAQFRRPVPAGSGLFLLLRGTALREAGGLGIAFPSRAHAVADLCLRLGEAGWDTLFEPLADVAYEYARTPTEGTADKLFAVRHAEALARHGLPPGGRPRCPIMSGTRKRLLLIDDRVPYPELGAGYPRSARMIHELHALGWFVTVFPNFEPDDDWPTVYGRFPREVEFMLGYGRRALDHFLHERAGFYDVVVVSRPHNMRDYLAARGATPRPARLIYDAEAVFAPREFLRLEQAGQAVDPEQRRAALAEEIGLTSTADVVTAVNEAEAELFRQGGCPRVSVLGLGITPAPAGPGFARRRDLLFVGAMGEDNSPNADGMTWFVGEVMPLLDRLIGPDYRLLVAGRCQAPSVLALASERVRVLGLVGDLSELYATARIFVAPTRYAAGLPLKVHEAAGRGLPVVGAALLGRQLGWRDGRDMLLATTAEEFAAACARLYCDPALWYILRRGGLDRLTEETKREDFTGTLCSVIGVGVT